MKWKVLVYLFLLSGSLQSSLVWASACCGRNSATPSLIVGDDHSQIGFGIAQSTLQAWVDEEGLAVFEPAHRSEILRTYRMDAATLLSDRFQIGLTLPVATRDISENQSSEATTGLGDLKFSLGYEILPAWTYSPWKPQGFIFASLTLPTGGSIYDSRTISGSDVIGNGYVSISIGSLWVKRWDQWDLFLVPEGHYSFSRTFELDGDPVRAIPGWGGSLALGGGWSPFGGALRVGLRFQPRVDQGVNYIGLVSEYHGVQSQGLMTSCDTGVDLNYILGSTDTLTFSYTDQLLLGVAMNSGLNRIFALSFQHRWER